MKCPKCGNEVSPEEVFCGQCGMPNVPAAQATEVTNRTTLRSGFLSGYNPNTSPPPQYNSGMQPPPAGANPPGLAAHNPNSPNTGLPSSSYRPSSANPLGANPAGPQQQGSFYQEPTEAMSVMPGSAGPSYPTQYPQQNFANPSMQGGYPGTGQFGPPNAPGSMQPFSTENYPGSAGPAYPQSQPFLSGQGYGGPAFTPPPPKQRNHTTLIIACVFLALALIAVIAFGSLYLLRGHLLAAPEVPATPTAAPTTAPTANPTATPSPTPAPSPTATPSPTAAPTPAPDPNFSWCGQACITNGFVVEYPNSWELQQSPDGVTIQFTNPLFPNMSATFRTPAGTTTMTASDWVNTDLQTNFANKKPGYMPPTTPPSNATIGGETWVYEIASYQASDGQNNIKERVEVFATVHQGKAYIIELQAPDSQFDTVNSQFFEVMLGRFQFQQPPS